MSTPWLVGIDDTDNAESIGTGRLARMLAEHLASAGHLAEATVTRHQLLVHPDIPYTSHNSSACIAGRSGARGADGLGEAARGFLEAHFHDGANPGLCAGPAEAVPDALVALARRAQREVLSVADLDALRLAAPLYLWWSGETGQGRIGAASAVALRRTGDDGRFIALGGIRDLDGRLAVADLLARSAVEAVVDEEGAPLAGGATVDTRGWVRPGLHGGRPVLRVRREEGVWVPAERRSKDA